MEAQRIAADLVLLAERGIIASHVMGEALLSRIPHEPVESSDPRIEVFRLSLSSSPWGSRVLFAWYTQGREGPNIRFADDLEELFDASRFLVLYRHRSNQGKRRLTIHPVGNFSTPPDPDYGPAHHLGYVDPVLMRVSLLCLQQVVQERELQDVDVSYEITHHGPTELKTPIHFYEIGDGPEQWEDPDLVDAAVEALVRLLSQPFEPPRFRCLGVSYGDHYALSYTRMTHQQSLSFGHLISTRALPEMTLEDFEQAIDKTRGGVDAILYKRLKGLPPLERKRLEGYCQKHGIRLQKYSKPLE